VLHSMKVSPTKMRYSRGTYTAYPERLQHTVIKKDAAPSPPRPMFPVSPAPRAKALADSRWWATSYVSGSTRQELLDLEPCFHEVFDRYAMPGTQKMQRSNFLELARAWKAGLAYRSRGKAMDWGRLFLAADNNEDGAVDWEEFWSFFSSSQLMGNSLQDYVTIHKLLKAWDHEPCPSCGGSQPQVAEEPVAEEPVAEETLLEAQQVEEIRTPKSSPSPRQSKKTRRCTHCGSIDHYVARCPKRKSGRR